MANRFWVGGTANWDGTAGTKWSATSGGAGGASVPTTADDVFFDGSSTGTCTIATGNTGARSINCTGFTGTLTGAANITVAGSVTLASAMGYGHNGNITFTGTGTITTAGKSFSGVIINGAGITVTLGDALNNSPRSVTLTQGTINLNNFTLTTNIFSSSNSNTRRLAFGTGSMTVAGTGTIWLMATTTNFTVTGTPVVNVTNATATATTVTPGIITEANSISFNFTAGTYSLTLSGGGVRSLNFTGFSGTLSGATRTIFGDLTLSAGMTLTAGFTTTFASTSATPRTIATNGKLLDGPLVFDGVGGTFRLLDALTTGATRAITHNNGTIDLNGFNLTVGGNYITGTGTKNLTFNGGTLTCANSGGSPFWNNVPTGFSTTAGTGTGTINMTAATAKTFIGGGSTFNCTLNNGGAGALTITGSNTFTTLANSVQPTSILFTAGTTTTLTNWNVNGTAGNLVTIGSTSASTHTLSKASGTVSANYLSISYSTATGGATWNAANSVDGGNNSGWIFAAFAIIAALAASEVGPDILAANAFIGYKVLAALSASEVGPDIFEAFATIGTPTPPVADAIYLVKLRSFTERRRF